MRSQGFYRQALKSFRTLARSIIDGNQALVLVGPFVHSLSLSDLHIVQYGIICVDEDGKITSVQEFESLSDREAALQQLDVASPSILRLREGQFICPGFIDTHTHAPQYVNLGLGLDKPLLEWLEAYTFPAEIKFGGDFDWISKIYGRMINHYLKSGTTTCCYYGSIHKDSCQILAGLTAKKGQRAFIGKTCMDQNHPENYGETTLGSLEDTRDFIKSVAALKSNLVQPVVTPRFAPTCSEELMAGLAQIAKAHKLNIQTHITESEAEVKWVRELFPKRKHYADIYDYAGLLTNRTLLAHALNLTEEEIVLLKGRGCSLAHCPNSNFALSSGVMNARRLLERGLNIGLGTDVSGGYSVSILDAMRHAIIASKVINFSHAQYAPLSPTEVFHLATLGGAKALGISEITGNLLVGKCFDAVVLDLTIDELIPINPSERVEELFKRAIFCADDRHIVQVYVQGRKVVDKT